VKLITFRRKIGAVAEPGILQKDTVYPLAPFGYADVESFIAAGAAALQSAQALIANSGIAKESTVPRSSVQLLSPLLRPPRIFCVGLNYQDHAAESKMVVQPVPTIFMKLASAISGPESDLVLPLNSTQPDYEAELAVVIGQCA
jgi:2-keto-4-pentenoate hydratase/2-oxohepta-3-ene-1,7-dioic acid hydratase in catechol pathway